VEAGSTQGTHLLNANTVVFDLGTIPARSQASMSVTALPSLAGVLTNRARLASPRLSWDPAAHQAEETTTVTLDRDGDGMADVWELMHGLSPSDPLDGGLDLDGDGATNLAEHEAGTDPGDAASVFKFRGIESTESGMAVSFLALSNRTYSVLHRASLTTGVWLKLGDVKAGPTNRIETLTDAGAGAGAARRYYQLTTPRLP
jgi:hypothetical protein